MNRLFLLAILFIMSAFAKADNEPTLLVVQSNDGSTRKFVLDKKPNITFDDEKIYIASADFSTEYSNIKNIYFTTDEVYSSISEDSNLIKDFTFTFVNGHTVIVECLNINNVVVSNIQGMAVKPTITTSSDGIVIELGSLSPGFYIIKVNSQTFKVYKK